MIELHQGDCFDIMPEIEERVKAVITDPPYGDGIENMGFTKNREGGVTLRNDYSGMDSWDKRVDLTSILQHEIVAIFGGNYYTDVLPPSRGWIVWDKKDGGYYSNDFADCELIWTNQDFPARVIRHLWHGMIQQNMKYKEKRYHPTQKPIVVMKFIIELLTEPGDTILDPFMGSGSTGVACRAIGRDFIGIELDEHYFEIAKKRINAPIQKELI